MMWGNPQLWPGAFNDERRRLDKWEVERLPLETQQLKACHPLITIFTLLAERRL